MFPAFMERPNIDLVKRPPLRPLRFANQPQPSVRRSAIGFLCITRDTGADDVLPRRRSASILWNDVIQIQITPFENATTVLARVAIALKNIVPRELDLFLRQSIKQTKQDHARHADLE